MITLAGIRRQTTYSPNHVSNDAKIFLRTVERLNKKGFRVNIYDEHDLGLVDIKERLIFSMAQGIDSTMFLKELEKEGKVIINSPKGSINSYRINMVKILTEKGLPFPKSIVINVEEKNKIKFEDFNARKIWIKRGDVHAVHREDVTVVYSEEEKNNIITEFARRGIRDVVLQEHLDGDVIKFYSVRNTSLFHWFYLNGINHTPFEIKLLKDLGNKAADALGLEVYGGDAIVSGDGKISIIDVNDWPSFAPVREEASKAIAELIANKINNFVSGEVYGSY
jgi:glutathione synthase/RimK-type ligase-like ATP-grasp enzyme